MALENISAAAVQDVWCRSGIAMIAIDVETGRIRAASDAALRLTGFTIEEICSLSPCDLYDDRYAVPAEDDPHSGEIVLLRCSDGSSREIRVSTMDTEVDGARTRFDLLLDATLEAAARREAALFQAIVESATDHIITSDRRGVITYANPAALGDLGYTRAELVGRFIGDLTPADEFSQLGADILELTSSGGEWRGEMVALRKDGTMYPAGIATSAVRDELGRPVALLLVARNMTREKEAQRELLFFRDALAKAMETVIATDLDGRITYINDAACVQYGYSREELLGRHVSILFSPGDASESGKRMFHSLLRGGDWQGELRTVGRAGDEHIVNLVAYRLDDADGHPVALVGLGRDITQRKQADERLRLLSSAVEQSTEGVAVTDLDGNLLFVNNAFAAMHRYRPEELIGRSNSILHAPDRFLSIEAASQRIRETGEFNGEVWHVRSDGEVFPGLMHNTLLRDETGTPIGMVAALRDITRRKRMEEALREGEASYRTLFEESPIALWEFDCSELKVHLDSLHAAGVTDFAGYAASADIEEVARCKSLIKIMNVNRATYELTEDGSMERLIERSKTVVVDRINDLDYDFITAIGEGKTQFDRELILKTALGRETYVAARWSVAPGHEENYSRVILSLVDITERKKFEQDLLRSERRYREIVQDQTELICRWQPAGPLTFVNDAYCRYFGKTHEELVGSSFTPEIPEEDKQDDDEYIASLTRENPVGVVAHRIIMPGNEIRWLQWTDRAIFDEHGNLQEIQSVGSDITERKRAEEEISRRNKELAGLHDLALAVSGHMDLDTLCAVAAQKMVALVDSDMGLTFLSDISNRVLAPVAASGLATISIDAIPPIPFGTGISGRAAASGEVYAVADLQEVESPFHELAVQERVENGAAIPLIAKQGLLGIILVTRRTKREFCPDELRLLGSAGRLLSLAVDNSRAIESERRRRAEMSVLYEIAAAGSRYHEIQPILDTSVAAIQLHMSDLAVGVMLGSEEDGELVLAASAGVIDPMSADPRRCAWGAGAVGRAASEQRTVIVGDLNDTGSVSVDTIFMAGVESVVLAPIVGGGRTLGVLEIRCSASYRYSGDDVSFLESAALQIGAAIHAVRLHQQTRAEAQRLAMIGDLERSILGTLSRQEMFQVVGEHVKDLIPCAIAAAVLRQPDGRTVLVEELCADESQEISPPLLISIDELASAEVVRTGNPLIRKDIREGARCPFDDRLIARGIVATLTVPIFAHGKLVGTLSWGARTPGAFTADHLPLAIEIANLVALALENIRAYDAEQRRAAELDGLHKAAGRLLAPQSVRDMAQTIAEAACDQLHYTRSCVALVDNDGLSMMLTAASGAELGQELLTYKWPLTPEAGFSLVSSILSGEPILIADVVAQTEFPADAFLAKHFRANSYAVAPLVVGDRPLGVIGVDRGPDGPPIEPEEMSVIGAYAHHAGLALQGARLLEETQQTLRLLRETQEELMRLERLRALGQVASGLAHDLNNRMAIISAHAELLMDSVEGAGQANTIEALTIIKAKAAEASDLVRRIQDATGRRRDTTFEKIDMCDTAQRAVWLSEGRRIYRSWQGAPSHEIDAQLTATNKVAASEQEIKDVIVSIIDNAIDAMPDGGMITLRVADEKGSVVVSVADTGPGIPVEILDRIFEACFTTKPDAAGGSLARAKGIVERHGGEIGVRNNEGGGAEVWFRLPVVGHARAASHDAYMAPRPGEVKALRILAVEDETLVRKLLAQMVRRDGHEVVEAPTAEAAVKKLEEGDGFDVIFTDLGLPGMNGWDLSDWIHTNRPATPVVLVTGWGDEISEQELASHHVAHLLAKPFTGSAVRRALASITKEADPPPRGRDL